MPLPSSTDDESYDDGFDSYDPTRLTASFDGTTFTIVGGGAGAAISVDVEEWDDIRGENFVPSTLSGSYSTPDTFQVLIPATPQPTGYRFQVRYLGELFGAAEQQESAFFTADGIQVEWTDWVCEIDPSNCTYNDDGEVLENILDQETVTL